MSQFKRYINICGVDGVGKSLFAKELAKEIGARFTYEPNGETEITKQLREFALDKTYNINNYTREYLMCANRSHQSMINRLYLDKDPNNIIVTDRGLLSGYAYANVDSGFNFRDWYTLHKYNFDVLKPDLIIYISNKNRKVDPEKDNVNDIYDHRDNNFFCDIEEAFRAGKKHFVMDLEIPIISYANDFSKSVNDNVNNVIKTLKFNGHIR